MAGIKEAHVLRLTLAMCTLSSLIEIMEKWSYRANANGLAREVVNPVPLVDTPNNSHSRLAPS